MHRLVYALVAGILISCPSAWAEDEDSEEMEGAPQINYGSISQAGFGDVAELLKSMTPAQQDAVLKAAEVRQEDLAKLSPEELQKLRAQLRQEGDTIYMDKIDPEKLNVSQAKSTQDTMHDLDTYQTKYDQGKIDNSAVKPNNAGQ